MCNRLTTVRPRNEVTLSQCACTDCWGCSLQHGALFSVRQFLEEESACQVLGSEKVLPMQVQVRVKNGRGCLTECRDSVRNALVLLFMLFTPFESARVAGAVESVDEVAIGLRLENKVEESQRCALRSMQNFTAAA